MIIDTETHVLRFARSYFNNRTTGKYPMLRHFTWHEHPAELLVSEMDNAGVDKTFLLSYDAEDTRWSALQHGYTMEDYAGGRKHTLFEARQFPDRFLWFNTVKDPKVYDSAELIRQDAAIGMVGIKLFPAYIAVSLVEETMRPIWETCRALDLRVLISFETLRPPQTRSLPEYLEELDELLDRYPDVTFALLHVGCADPLAPEATQVFDNVNRHPNLYLSTAFPGEKWDDGTEYPFRNYLRRIQATVEAVGAGRAMWASDWPWFDWAFKYEQGVNAIRRHADFLSEEDQTRFLGGTAAEFMGDRIGVQVAPE
jgi:predicted TIM-barrel fold metal-dependent hydrolase